MEKSGSRSNPAGHDAMDPNDPVNFLQQRFDEAQQHLKRDWRIAWVYATVRRWIAYLLKAIGIFGGIAVASGLQEDKAHIVGILIAVAVGFDTLLQNYNRLIAMQEASYAYRELFYRVAREYNQKLGVVKVLQGKGDSTQARESLIELLQDMTYVVNSGQEALEKAWKDADLAALRSLSLEQSNIARN